MATLLPLVKLLRPQQWYKNLLVFLAALFSHNALELPLYPRLIGGFFLLSLVSGSSYILNDIRDVASDRVHPRKAQRPLASGKVSVRTALTLLGIVLVPSLLLSYWLDVLFALFCVALFVTNVSYTFWLKQIVFADVLSIAAGFVIRGIAGAVLIPVTPSSWFAYGIFFAALLLALGKRSGELRNLGNAELHRPVLSSYSQELIFFSMTSASTLVIVFYVLYVTLGPPRAGSLLPTVPLVVFMVFRYLYLTFTGDGSHERAESLFHDRQMMLAGSALLFLIIVLFYFLPPLF